MLRPADGQTGLSPLPGRLDAENRFVTAQYPPGRYLLSMSAPPPWTIKSILVGARDLTRDAIELTDTDLENVVITFTDRPASLSGTVRGSGANRSDGATVAVFPADVRGWIARGMASVSRYTAVADANGSFSVPNLFPGEYLAVAIDADRHVDLDDPSVYDALVRAATPVRIRDGAQANATLSATTLR
jgi:hypothetical protein